MRWWLGILLWLSLCGPALAQSEEDDKSYLEGLIEDSLSGAGREVTVTGFRGALSSNATLDKLTIADEDGIWFTLEDASLIWSRTALLRGRLDVSELTATRIELTRIPKSNEPVTPGDTETTPFALPDLPVSVDLGELRADLVVLGQEVLGERTELRLDSSLQLAEGAGQVSLAIQRLDNSDEVTLDAGFDNETRILALALDFNERAGGMISRLLKIPGTPSLRLQVTGEAPISDFMAQVALASDGVRRFGGTVQIAAQTPAEQDTVTGYEFGANLSGDLRPLFTAELHPFFGDMAALEVTGITQTDGALDLTSLRLATDALNVNGALSLAPDGWPERFALTGEIASEGRVRLPTVHPPVTLDRLEFDAQFDAARDENWQVNLALEALERDGMKIDLAQLTGRGAITRGAVQRLTADLNFALDGFAHPDAALSQAIGRAPQGDIAFDWPRGAPLNIEALTLQSGDLRLSAQGVIERLAEGFPVNGRAVVEAADLRRFAPLADRALAGQINATLEGRGSLLGGDFDVDLAANTRDLAVAEPRIDPLLQGVGRLDLSAQRDEAGLRVDRFEIRTPEIRAEATGQLNGETGALSLDARLAELARIDPRLAGPADITTQATWRTGDVLSVEELRIEALEARLTARGEITPEDPALPAKGTLSLMANDLSKLAGILARPLSGELRLDLTGDGTIRDAALGGSIALTARELVTGIAQLDNLTAGEFRLNGKGRLSDGIPFVENLDLETPRLTVLAQSTTPSEPLTLTARLTNLGLLAPGINGPAQLDGTMDLLDPNTGDVAVDLAFKGPGGISAQIDGRVLERGQTLDLGLRGQAPLSLANEAIAPRSITGPVQFDLRLNGAPALSSMSGRATIAQARVALPSVNMALSDLSGVIELAGGQAIPNITGTAGTGGQFRITGPVALTAPNQASLEIILSRLGFADPSLFQTTLDGTIRVQGPLTGGASISGAITLGRTELQVPSGNSSTRGTLPDLKHVAEPAAVRQTRRRAGLIKTTRGGPAAAFPLNLTINAPNQIFVRGRGLDAELGGQLQLGGTTANVVASGFFELIRGRIDVLTKRLDLTEGLIDLRGALDPYLRFVARTQTDDYTIDVVLEGLASEPEVSFTSSPDLPQEEIVAQLLFGRSFADMSALQAAQLVGAVATLSGRGSGGLTGRFRNALGISDFDVTSTSDGATEFSAGTYISDNIYSEIVADSDGNNEINLNLDLSPSLTVKGSAGNDGNTGLGIFFEKDY